MTCRDFERNWHALLDGDAPGAAVREAQAAHEAQCPRCRELAARLGRLERALRSWGLPPEPSPGFAGRVLDAHHAPAALPMVRSRARFVALATRWAVAAAVLVAGLVAFRGATRPVPAPAPRAAPAPSARTLSLALADATTATLELARETSAPAARVGRRVLGSATVPDAGAALPIPVTAAPAARVLQALGDRVDDGVRPLSGTARRAFSFLVPTLPPGDEPEDAARAS